MNPNRGNTAFQFFTGFVGVKNLVKLAILCVGGLVLFVYFIFLFSGKIGKDASMAKPAKSTDPVAVASAQTKLSSFLDEKTFVFIKGHQTSDARLTIKADGMLWKKVSHDDKKTFLRAVADSRSTLGLMPTVLILDNNTGYELASFENGRASFSGLD